jgi:quinoprotein glucose dehydrogenase
VNLLAGVGKPLWHGEYQVTSPPVVIGEVVAVGSAVSDNARTDAPSGVVRGFDVRSGALRWAQDLAPPGAPRPPPAADGSPRYVPGTPNVWAPMSADRRRDLLFVPTGNPAPDYWRGGELRGGDYYGSSTVALRGATGEVQWHFQTVHHDLWDFDVPAQPTLGEVPREGKRVPAVIQATKMGHVFVLHRETGEPLFPVEERPVPQGGAPGEELATTQPFPVKPPPLARASLPPEDAWGLVWFDPGNAGGSNWGGVALDPGRNLLFANTMNLPWVVTLYPGEEYERRKAESPVEHAPQRGTPFGLRREALLSPLGLPCSPPPWGELAAVDLASGDLVWQVPLGTVRDLAPVPIPWRLGTPNLGGPLATASGLVFIGAAMDDYLRAFDAATGDELWKGRLPAGGQATPMTYEVAGRQFVVIAAGGHFRAGTRLGDALVAFALPAQPEG